MARRHAPFALLLLAVAAAAQPTVAGYTTQQLHGFDVLVLDEGTASYPADMNAALTELDHQLGQVVALGLPSAVLSALRGVKIFVNWNTREGAAQYHPSRQWLIDNGFEPEMERSVDISNARNFAAWSQQNQPWMTFHELTHAYHHQALGYDHPPTLAAYQNALDTGILDSVPYDGGSGPPYVSRPAYARNNEIEYLAEISEAFVGRNDFYPFVRSDLETHDPQGFALAQSIWEAGRTSAEMGPEPLAFAAFPNPTTGRIVLEAAEPLRVTVYDALGRAVRSLDVAPGRTVLDLDLDGAPAGVYHVLAVSSRATASQPVVLVR